MLLMSLFYKTVINISYHYHQGSTDRYMDQEPKYVENKNNEMSYDVIKIDCCYSPSGN